MYYFIQPKVNYKIENVEIKIQIDYLIIIWIQLEYLSKVLSYDEGLQWGLFDTIVYEL